MLRMKLDRARNMYGVWRSKLNNPEKWRKFEYGIPYTKIKCQLVLGAISDEIEYLMGEIEKRGR